MTSEKLTLESLGKLLIVFCKSAIHLLFDGPKMLSSASDKAKLFPKNFSKNSNLEDSSFPLPAFYYRNNLKLHIS